MSSSSLTLRPMTVDDLATVSQLGIDSKSSWGYDDDAMRIFSDELTLSRESLVEILDAKVAYKNNQIVGYFTLRNHADGVTELEHLFVQRDQFRKGVGTKLLLSALASARRSGIEALTIIADPHSSGFYEKHGAVRVGDHRSSIAGRVIPVYELATSVSIPMDDNQ